MHKKLPSLTYIFRFVFFLLMSISFSKATAQNWTPLDYLAPDPNGGVMVLLSNGTVLCKTSSGGGDGIGDTWNILTPDFDGTYRGGTWTTATPMHNTRLYFSSRLLKDGRLYVAGGEYGTGASKGEVYNPQTDTWTPISNPPSGTYFYDANSELLPDGRVLQDIVYSTIHGYLGVLIYNPATNAYTTADDCLGSPDESSWVLLADSSVLFVDIGSTNSERYIPSLNQWVVDDTLPIQLYDDFQSEMGPGFLLPDGRAFMIGGVDHTLYYTPSGSISPGSWAAGPNIPMGLASTDGAGSMMPNGKILLALAPQDQDTANVYLSPTYFYEFNYLTNTFTHVLSPGGFDSLNIATYVTNMLNLPDGTILYSTQGDDQYYIYDPGGTQLAAGKPTIAAVSPVSCDIYTIRGTLFNGISEGAGYGDDWQMATNYPIVRLTQGPNAYYARTFNWNRTGVQTGALPDTAFFELPVGLPAGSFNLEVIANGIHSDSYSFTPCSSAGIDPSADGSLRLQAFPNPAHEQVTLMFSSPATHYTLTFTDISGRVVKSASGTTVEDHTSVQVDVNGLAAGAYTVVLETQAGSVKTKLIVQ